MVALEGQQRELVTKALVNFTPPPARRFLVSGIRRRSETLISSVSTKRILGFVDGVVWARLLCVRVTVRPKPVSTPNKSVAISSTDCFIRIRTLLLRCVGRTTLTPANAYYTS